jgi:hypothetical protein
VVGFDSKFEEAIMGVSIRSFLTVGVATITAVTIAVVPSVKEPVAVASRPPVVHIASPAVALTAALATPTVTATDLPNLLVEWLQKITVPPSANTPFPTPQFPPVVAPTSLGSSIKGIYNAVFDVAAYAVGWIPYFGWLSPQISIFYDFGEQIVRSITFNIADWLDRRISFGQGLVNVGVDTVNAFIWLANAQLGFWLPPLPPIPPIPPIFLPGTAAVMSAEVTEPVESMAKMSAELPGSVTLVDETQDPASADTQGDVVEGAAVDAVDATATVQESTVVEAEDATLEEVSPVGDEPAQKESTTSFSGTVKAQGEVRTGSQATGKQVATAHKSPATAKPVDKPSDPKSVVSEAADTTTHEATTVDKAGAEKNASAGAGKDTKDTNNKTHPASD